jgi:RND family efflux transporter MFP subunit
VSKIAGARYSGTMEPEERIELAFRVGGYVESIAIGNGTTKPLAAGDRVTRGMRLARLRQGDYRQRLLEVDAVREEASASYGRAKADAERATSLLASGSISRAEHDALRARSRAAAASVGAASARSGQTKLTLEDTELRSPIDGMVLERTVESGELVAPGAHAFVLADTSSMHVVFGVPDSVQQKLTLGDEVAVECDGVPDRVLSAVVTKIAPQAEPRTRSFEIEASLPNEGGAIKPGMVVSVELRSPRGKPEVLAVSLNAVVHRAADGPNFMVYVAEASEGVTTVRARSVELGDLTGNRVTVLSGLAPGDRIVVQGATMVSDGARVSIVPSPAPGAT